MSHWKRKRVFVTGATGLLGGWLVRALLDQGAEVTCLVRDHVPASMFQAQLREHCNVVSGDVRNAEPIGRALHEYRSEVVFHLAAQTLVETALEDPEITFDVNVTGTLAVCAAVRSAKRWVEACVVASSDKAYGDHGGKAYREGMELRAVHPYDASKAAAEYIARSYAETYELPISLTRCGNFFGGGDINFSRIVPGTIRSIFDGQAPLIRSDGQAIRDYIYVKDGAHAYMWLAAEIAKGNKLAKGVALNFGYEDPASVLVMVGLVMGSMKKLGFEPQEPVIEDRVGSTELSRQTLSTEAARYLGWEPTFGLVSAIDETCAWYVERFEQERARLAASDRERAERSH